MIFITGGAYQGKTEYAMKNFDVKEENILNCEGYDGTMSPEFYFMKNTAGIKCVKNLQELIKSAVEAENLSIQNMTMENMIEDIKDSLEELTERNPDVVIIMDEVGSGIVPIEKGDRDYREAVGNVGCFLAQNASKVVRVICGIGQVIK
jgi:adenosylcobinamide kinase/adenosylcobinamide-phosphate guanylyltransferase